MHKHTNIDMCGLIWSVRYWRWSVVSVVSAIWPAQTAPDWHSRCISPRRKSRSGFKTDATRSNVASCRNTAPQRLLWRHITTTGRRTMTSEPRFRSGRHRLPASLLGSVYGRSRHHLQRVTYVRLIRRLLGTRAFSVVDPLADSTATQPWTLMASLHQWRRFNCRRCEQNCGRNETVLLSRAGVVSVNWPLVPACISDGEETLAQSLPLYLFYW